MLKLCVIGAGDHSRRFHLPALDRYRREFPDRIELAAVCDVDAARAGAAANDFAIRRVYGDLDRMLAMEKPDASIACTPVALNASVALKLARAGIPGLMEKPPAATLEEARALVAETERLQARLMVSVNRRFDPVRLAALAWVGKRPICIARFLMARHERRESRFLEETAIHAVDGLRSIMGEPLSVEAHTAVVAGATWWHLGFRFASGALAVVDIAPSCGAREETVELLGPGFRCVFGSTTIADSGWEGWAEGRRQEVHRLPAGTPEFVANGTAAETAAFLAAVRGERLFAPTPADVVQSMSWCARVREEARSL